MSEPRRRLAHGRDRVGTVVALSLAWILALGMIVPLPAVTAAILRVTLAIGPRPLARASCPSSSPAIRESWRRATGLGLLVTPGRRVDPRGRPVGRRGDARTRSPRSSRTALVLLAAWWALVNVYLWPLVGGNGHAGPGRSFVCRVGLSLIELPSAVLAILAGRRGLARPDRCPGLHRAGRTGPRRGRLGATRLAGDPPTPRPAPQPPGDSPPSGTPHGVIHPDVIDTHVHVGRAKYGPVEAYLADDGCGSACAAPSSSSTSGNHDDTYLARCLADASRVGSPRSAPSTRTTRRRSVGSRPRSSQSGIQGLRLTPGARSPGRDPLAIWRRADELGLIVSVRGPFEDVIDPAVPRRSSRRIRGSASGSSTLAGSSSPTEPPPYPRFSRAPRASPTIRTPSILWSGFYLNSSESVSVPRLAAGRRARATGPSGRRARCGAATGTGPTITTEAYRARDRPGRRQRSASMTQ